MSLLDSDHRIGVVSAYERKLYESRTSFEVSRANYEVHMGRNGRRQGPADCAMLSQTRCREELRARTCDAPLSSLQEGRTLPCGRLRCLAAFREGACIKPVPSGMLASMLQSANGARMRPKDVWEPTAMCLASPIVRLRRVGQKEALLRLLITAKLGHRGIRLPLRLPPNFLR